MASLWRKKTTPIKEEERGVAAVLSPERLTNIEGEPTSRAELERIIKTTDSMNIALSSDLLKTKNALGPREQSELNSIREAITRSYDLARRKITTQYEQIVLNNNYVDNPFLAIQVTIKNIDQKWDVQKVERIIRKFTDAIVEQIALGKTVYLNDELIIEPLSYVDKILPTWKTTPKFAILTNAVKWDQIVTELDRAGEVSEAEAMSIVREAVEAITQDVKNGYFVKVSRFIIMQIQAAAPQKIVLFSNDTLERINEIYERFLKTGEAKDIRKYDALVHFDKTLENVERGFYSDDIKKVALRPGFVPRDLTQEIDLGTKKAKAKGATRKISTATKETPRPTAKAPAIAATAAQTKTATTKIKLPEVKASTAASKTPTPTTTTPTATNAAATATKQIKLNRTATMRMPAPSKKLEVKGKAPAGAITTPPKPAATPAAPTPKPTTSSAAMPIQPIVMPTKPGAAGAKPTPTPAKPAPTPIKPAATPAKPAITAKPATKRFFGGKSPQRISMPTTPTPKVVVKPVTTTAPATPTPKPTTLAATPAAKAITPKPKAKRKPKVVARPSGTFTYTNLVDTTTHQLPATPRATSASKKAKATGAKKR